MKIKLNELHQAEWKYMNCSEFNCYESKLILYRESKKYGYRFNIIQYNNEYYITQALYNPMSHTENISVHPVKNVNDAKAILEVMLQFVRNMHKRVPEVAARA